MPHESNPSHRFQEIPNWTPWEQNLLSQIESAWTALQIESTELQSAQSSESGADWGYGPEATTFLDALENLFEEIDEKRRTASIEWSKSFLTQSLADFESIHSMQKANIWGVLTYLRATTRFSRFPDNNDGGWFASHFVAGGVARAMERLRELVPMANDKIAQVLTVNEAYCVSLENRMPVIRSDWINEPMGPAFAEFSLDIRLSSEAMNVVRLGLIPNQMEDKWFLFFEEPVLHFHRSWTGFEAFTMRIEDSPEGYRIKGIKVSQCPESVTFESAKEGAELALTTLCVCLLGKELPPNGPCDVIHQWHSFGQQAIGYGPLPGKLPSHMC